MIIEAAAPSLEALVLGPEDDGRILSAEQFAHAVPVGPYRYERSDGRLIVMPPDGKDHTIVSFHWHAPLCVYALDHPDVLPLVSTPCWIRLDDETDRIADFGVYLRRDAGPPEPPDLVFEVVSPGKVNRERDYVRKKAECHRIGIREYVIIDRFRRTVTVCSHQPAGYEERVLTATDVYETPLLPGFALPLAQAFRDE